MASKPSYANLVLLAQVQIATANTNRDGTGTLGTLLAGPAAASGIIHILPSLIRIQATGTTTAGMVRFFIESGSTKRLWKERRVTPITPAATVKAFEDEFRVTDLGLPDSTWTIYCSTEKAETFNVFVFGGKAA